MAVVMIVTAAISGWWPTGPRGGGTGGGSAGDSAARVEIRDGAGRRFCGELVDAPTGWSG